jgi:ABC-type glycerol-3-phosphate transport system substrate-binding protein
MFLVAAALGCRRTGPDTPPPPHRGARLTLACPAAVRPAVEAQARLWAARQQASVEVVTCSAPEELPGAGADVWVVRPADLPRWAAADRLALVPDALTGDDGAYDWRGLLPIYRENLLRWGRQAYSLPLLGEAPVLCLKQFGPAEQKKYQGLYDERRAKAGRSSRELGPPATWEELAELAELLRDHHPSGRPAPSLPPLPADDEALDRLFYQVAACCARRAVGEEEHPGDDVLEEVFSFHYDLHTGEPRIASPGFVHALRLLQRLQACRPRKAAQRPHEALLRGGAVLGIVEAPAVAELQQAKGWRDSFAVAAVPGAGAYFTFKGEKKEVKGESNRVPYLGGAGWLGAVPRSAGNAEAAWALLAHLSGPAEGARLALGPHSGGGPTRQEHLTRERWDAFDLDRARTAALREAVGRTVLRHGVKNPVACLRTPDQAEHRKALVAAVRRALEGGADAEKALAAAARGWKKLDASKGPEAVKAEYRLSLGLRAR